MVCTVFARSKDVFSLDGPRQDIAFHVRFCLAFSHVKGAIAN